MLISDASFPEDAVPPKITLGAIRVGFNPDAGISSVAFTISPVAVPVRDANMSWRVARWRRVGSIRLGSISDAGTSPDSGNVAPVAVNGFSDPEWASLLNRRFDGAITDRAVHECAIPNWIVSGSQVITPGGSSVNLEL